MCIRDRYGRVVTNPPYGERLLEQKEAEELYCAFGRAVDKLCLLYTSS